MRLRRVQLGLLLVGLILLLALLGPRLAPHGATDYVGPPNSTAVADAVFGTDGLGQDVWSRFLLGGRVLLVSAALATLLGLAAGTALGLTAAVAPRRIEELLMRSIDVLLAIPDFLLVLVALTAIGPERWLIVALVALTQAPRVARVAYGAAKQVSSRDFVQVSEALGESTFHVVRTDLLPNVSGPLLVEAGIRFTYALVTIATLAFLGFTADPTLADWGAMVQENRTAVAAQPWGVALPVLALTALTVGAGLVADGLARSHARTGVR